MQSDLFEINYQLVRSRRKTVAIHVLRNGDVEVRAPLRASRDLIHQFVLEKQDWIERKQAEWQALPSPHQLQYKEGAEHFFLGEPHQLVLSPPQADEAAIELNVRQPSPDTIRRALERWYRLQAEIIFIERHEHWRRELAHFELPASRVALRKMKSRWGSCSRRGLVTLNTQLVRYPLECVDAVIVHELCHLLEFNHSRRFYRLMDQAYPNWKAIDKLLKSLALQY